MILPVQHTARHVLPMPRVTLDHLVGRFKAGVCDFGHRHLLMVCFLGRDDWSVGRQGEVDSRVGHQICLRKKEKFVRLFLKYLGLVRVIRTRSTTG